MFDFERPNIEVAKISDDKKYGKFVVEPLERGYGIHWAIPFVGLCSLHYQEQQ